MKKILILFIAVFLLGSNAYASCTFNRVCNSKVNIIEENQIKSVLRQYVNYENSKNVNGLETLFVENYLTTDAMPKKIYMDIIGKTWGKYAEMKHSLKVHKIEVNGNYATVLADEIIVGTSKDKLEEEVIVGDLKSVSSVVYNMEKVQGGWKFISDYVVSEQTSLIFKEANNLNVTFTAPSRVLENEDYVAMLTIKDVPRGHFVIATIGQEQIIYPHKNAEEVYRKLPQTGILERVFKANGDKLNEYTVATYCLTKPKLNKLNNQIEPILVGVGYVINRVNIVPKNNFIKVEEDGKKEEIAR